MGCDVRANQIYCNVELVMQTFPPPALKLGITGDCATAVSQQAVRPLL